MKARISDKNSQQGWVLVIGLVVLVMLTLIAMALMRTTLLEEKMAGASRDINLSFEAAEAGLRRGDVIASVSLEEVDSAEDFEEALREASEEGKERVPLLINRRGRESFLTLEVDAG